MCIVLFETRSLVKSDDIDVLEGIIWNGKNCV